MNNIEFSKKLKKNSEQHDYLYHYTNVDSICKIFETKSLRFSRTDKTNDLDEVKRKRGIDFDYYVFCFTHLQKESIPLWLIYANKNCSQKFDGIRLRIKSRNFYENGKIYFFSGGKMNYFKDEIISSSHIPSKILRHPSGYIEVSKPSKVDVCYCDQKKIDISYVKKQDYGSVKCTGIYPDVLVGVKGEAWFFEHETRFYVHCNTSEHFDIEYIFIEFNDYIFDELILTFNPFAIPEEKNKIKDKIRKILNEKEFSKIVFEDSELEGKIRV